MLALPLAKLAVGVKTAVRVRPVPLMAPKVPPVTVISPTEPFHAKLLPGSSVNVKMILAVSPDFRVLTLEVIAKVGVSVSIDKIGVVPATPLLPAAS